MSHKWRANIACVALWGGWLWMVDFTTTRAVDITQHEGFAFVIISLIIMMFATSGVYHVIKEIWGAKQRQS